MGFVRAASFQSPFQPMLLSNSTPPSATKFELAAKLSEIAEPEPRYTLTEAGKAYRAAMTDASLGGQVKAGEE